MKKVNFPFIIIITLFFSIVLFLFSLYFTGAFNQNKIVVTTLATTGPDYKVVLGQSKLYQQLSDTVKNLNTGGIMTTRQADNFYIYINSVMGYGDYYVITYKIKGAKPADGAELYPIVEILSWYRIEWIIYWLFIIVDIVLFFPFLFWLAFANKNQKKN